MKNLFPKLYRTTIRLAEIQQRRSEVLADFAKEKIELDAAMSVRPSAAQRATASAAFFQYA